MRTARSQRPPRWPASLPRAFRYRRPHSRQSVTVGPRQVTRHGAARPARPGPGATPVVPANTVTPARLQRIEPPHFPDTWGTRQPRPGHRDGPARSPRHAPPQRGYLKARQSPLPHLEHGPAHRTPHFPDRCAAAGAIGPTPMPAARSLFLVLSGTSATRPRPRHTSRTPVRRRPSSLRAGLAGTTRAPGAARPAGWPGRSRQTRRTASDRTVNAKAGRQLHIRAPATILIATVVAAPRQGRRAGALRPSGSDNLSCTIGPASLA